ncbi:MAG: hypothetical protein JSV34_05310, partial [Candidatus Omnitrophota bacterium]
NNFDYGSFQGAVRQEPVVVIKTFDFGGFRKKWFTIKMQDIKGNLLRIKKGEVFLPSNYLVYDAREMLEYANNRKAGANFRRKGKLKYQKGLFSPNASGNYVFLTQPVVFLPLKTSKKDIPVNDMLFKVTLCSGQSHVLLNRDMYTGSKNYLSVGRAGQDSQAWVLDIETSDNDITITRYCMPIPGYPSSWFMKTGKYAYMVKYTVSRGAAVLDINNAAGLPTASLDPLYGAPKVVTDGTDFKVLYPDRSGVMQELRQIRGRCLGAVARGRDWAPLITLADVGGTSGVDALASKGGNVFRIYGLPDDQLLEAFADRGLYILVEVDIFKKADHKQFIKDHSDKLQKKNWPILGYVFVNEPDLKMKKTDVPAFLKKLEPFISWVNTTVPHLITAIAWRDLPDAQTVALLPQVKLWIANVYRWDNPYSINEEWRRILVEANKIDSKVGIKLLLVGEFGADSFDGTTLTPNEQNQAAAVFNQWLSIDRISTVYNGAKKLTTIKELERDHEINLVVGGLGCEEYDQLNKVKKGSLAKQDFDAVGVGDGAYDNLALHDEWLGWNTCLTVEPLTGKVIIGMPKVVALLMQAVWNTFPVGSEFDKKDPRWAALNIEVEQHLIRKTTEPSEMWFDARGITPSSIDRGLNVKGNKLQKDVIFIPPLSEEVMDRIPFMPLRKRMTLPAAADSHDYDWAYLYTPGLASGNSIEIIARDVSGREVKVLPQAGINKSREFKKGEITFWCPVSVTKMEFREVQMTDPSKTLSSVDKLMDRAKALVHNEFSDEGLGRNSIIQSSQRAEIGKELWVISIPMLEEAGITQIKEIDVIVSGALAANARISNFRVANPRPAKEDLRKDKVDFIAALSSSRDVDGRTSVYAKDNQGREATYILSVPRNGGEEDRLYTELEWWVPYRFTKESLTRKTQQPEITRRGTAKVLGVREEAILVYDQQSPKQPKEIRFVFECGNGFQIMCIPTSLARPVVIAKFSHSGSFSDPVALCYISPKDPENDIVHDLSAQTLPTLTANMIASFYMQILKKIDPAIDLPVRLTLRQREIIQHCARQKNVDEMVRSFRPNIAEEEPADFERTKPYLWWEKKTISSKMPDSAAPRPGHTIEEVYQEFSRLREEGFPGFNVVDSRFVDWEEALDLTLWEVVGYYKQRDPQKLAMLEELISYGKITKEGLQRIIDSSSVYFDFGTADDLFADLMLVKGETGYINEEGQILPEFMKVSGADDMVLSSKYKLIRDQIYMLFFMSYMKALSSRTVRDLYREYSRVVEPSDFEGIVEDVKALFNDLKEEREGKPAYIGQDNELTLAFEQVTDSSDLIVAPAYNKYKKHDIFNVLRKRYLRKYLVDTAVLKDIVLEGWVTDALEYYKEANPAKYGELRAIVKSGRLRAGPDNKEIFWGANDYHDKTVPADKKIYLTATNIPYENKRFALSYRLIQELNADEDYENNEKAAQEYEVWKWEKEVLKHCDKFAEQFDESGADLFLIPPHIGLYKQERKQNLKHAMEDVKNQGWEAVVDTAARCFRKGAKSVVGAVQWFLSMLWRNFWGFLKEIGKVAGTFWGEFEFSLNILPSIGNGVIESALVVYDDGGKYITGVLAKVSTGNRKVVEFLKNEKQEINVSDYVDVRQLLVLIEDLLEYDRPLLAKRNIDALMEVTKCGKYPVVDSYNRYNGDKEWYNPREKQVEVVKATSDLQSKLALLALKVAQRTGEKKYYQFSYNLTARLLEFNPSVRQYVESRKFNLKILSDKTIGFFKNSIAKWFKIAVRFVINLWCFRNPLTGINSIRQDYDFEKSMNIAIPSSQIAKVFPGGFADDVTIRPPMPIAPKGKDTVQKNIYDKGINSRIYEAVGQMIAELCNLDEGVSLTEKQGFYSLLKLIFERQQALLKKTVFDELDEAIKALEAGERHLLPSDAFYYENISEDNSKPQEEERVLPAYYQSLKRGMTFKLPPDINYCDWFSFETLGITSPDAVALEVTDQRGKTVTVIPQQSVNYNGEHKIWKVTMVSLRKKGIKNISEIKVKSTSGLKISGIYLDGKKQDSFKYRPLSNNGAALSLPSDINDAGEFSFRTLRVGDENELKVVVTDPSLPEPVIVVPQVKAISDWEWEWTVSVSSLKEQGVKEISQVRIQVIEPKVSKISIADYEFDGSLPQLFKYIWGMFVQYNMGVKRRVDKTKNIGSSIYEYLRDKAFMPALTKMASTKKRVLGDIQSQILDAERLAKRDVIPVHTYSFNTRLSTIVDGYLYYLEREGPLQTERKQQVIMLLRELFRRHSNADIEGVAGFGFSLDKLSGALSGENVVYAYEAAQRLGYDTVLPEV